MDNIQQFFEVQKEFSKYNKYIANILAFYNILILLFGRYNNGKEFVFAFAVILALLVDWFAGSRQYWHSKVVFRIIKQVILFFTAVTMVYNNGIYLTIVVMSTLYIAIIFQYFFLYDVAESFYRITALLETMVSLLIVVFAYYIFWGKSNFEIFLAIFFICVMVCIIMSDLRVAAELINKLLNNLFRQERIAINSHKEYENLKVYQSRLVRANEQLSIQKFQMEQMNKSINEKNRQMDLQYKIMKHISGSLELDKLMGFITSSIIDNIKVDLCIIFVYDINKDEEVNEKFYNIEYSAKSRLNEETVGLFMEYAQSEEFPLIEEDSIICNNVEPGCYRFLEGSDISSLLMYPINISDDIKGIFVIGNTSSGYFTDNNKDFYMGITEQIVLAVNNASMYAKMQDMATKDPLTSIYNRRHFNSIYPEFEDKALKSDEPLTVILFDIDKFKNVNDQYGHLFGDQVIRFCGSIAGKVAKKNNGMAVRYGGEEFVIIFPDKNVETVIRIVEDMHRQIKEKEFLCEGQPVHINVSIGISAYPETCMELHELLNRADLAMYHSKNTGRGRITIDSPKVRGEEE